MAELFCLLTTSVSRKKHRFLLLSLDSPSGCEEKIEEFLTVERSKRTESITELVSHFVKNYPSFISLYSNYGKINPEDHERMRVHDNWNHDEVFYTIFTPECKSTLDYIFMWNLSHSKFRLKKLLSIPTPDEIKIEGKESNLPNEKHSSDHISLMVELEVLKVQEK